jgi:DNA ligase (NAD+)
MFVVKLFCHLLLSKKMNQDLIEIGETPYSNPRNTASGSLKLQDSAEVAKDP